MNKIYKGVIHSLLPQKGFGFITPIWDNGDSEENIFFHLSETKGGKCYIPALASEENRETVTSKRGTVTYVPKEVQVVFFELSAQERDNGVKLIAKKIRDAKHVSDEEAAAADANTEKPSVDELLHPTEETVNLAVTPETINQPEEPVDAEESCTAAAEETEVVETVVEENAVEETEAYEEEAEDDYYDEYEDEYGYLQDEYDASTAKASKRYSPKDNKKDQ